MAGTLDTLGGRASVGMPQDAGVIVRVEPRNGDLVGEVAETACAIAGEWALLSERAAGPAFYQSIDWCNGWIDACARSGRPERVRIVTVRERGRLVLVWPLALRTIGPARLLYPLGSPATQYADVLIDPDTDADEALRAACRTIERMGTIDAVVLKGVRRDAAVSPMCTRGEHGWRVFARGASPFLRLSQGLDPGVAGVLRTGRSLNALRRHGKHLAKLGPLVYERVEGAEQERVVAEALALKAIWLREQDTTSAGYLHPANAILLSRLAREGRFTIFRLSVGGRTAAIEIGILDRGHYLSMIQSYDRRFATHSPGRLLLFDIFQNPRSDIGTFDFMAPVLPHKTEWTDQAMPLEDAVWALSRRGQVADVYVRWVRPTLVRAFKALPARLRERLARLPFVVNG